jgi:hypothetical protein
MRPCVTLVLVTLHAAWATDARGQEAEVSRLVAQALRSGDEITVAHLGDEIGPQGIAECLQHASRSGQLLCVQAARHLSQPWPVLAVLAAALRSHNRELASRVAESMVAILADLQAGDLGPQEALPGEVESLLRALGRAASGEHISPDVRAQAVQAAGALARVAGAGLAVPRAALDDEHRAVRRAAVAALVGSSDPEDIAALGEATGDREDLLLSALAAAGVCEVTAGEGRVLPARVEERLRALLQDERARPSLIAPVLACLARAPGERVSGLRELAERHPNEATREAWRAMISGQEP